MKNITRITLLSIVLASVMFGHSQAQAAIAFDAANDAVYNNGWQSGDNGGTGFGAWTLSGTGGGSGVDWLIGSSAANGAGDIDVGGESFGLNNDDLFFNTVAARILSTPMSAGQAFNVNIDAGTITSGGQVGFRLANSGIAMTLFFASGGAEWQITDASGIGSLTGVSSGADLAVEILIGSGNSYDITLNGGTPLSRTFGGSGAIGSVGFFNESAGPDPANDIYFNSMEVVPEPAVTGGLACLVVLGAVLARKRWSGLRVQN